MCPCCFCHILTTGSWTIRNCVVLLCPQTDVLCLYTCYLLEEIPSRAMSLPFSRQIEPASPDFLKWQWFKFTTWSYDITILSFDFFGWIKLAPGNILQCYSDNSDDYLKAQMLLDYPRMYSNRELWPWFLQVSGEWPDLTDRTHAEECWRSRKRRAEGWRPAGHCESTFISISLSLLIPLSLSRSLPSSVSYKDITQLHCHYGWIQNGSRRCEQSKSQCCLQRLTVINCHFCLGISFRMQKMTRGTFRLNTRRRIPSACQRLKGSSRISSWIWTKPRKWNTHRQQRSRKSEYTNSKW